MEGELFVAEDVAEKGLDLFLEAHPTTVVLSGGSTPGALYRRLADSGYGWARMELFFGDERCVDPTSPDSNYRMVHEALLSRVEASAYPIDGASCDAEGYERLLRERFGSRVEFDLAIYGLGSDGHTASLFPGRPELEVSDRLAVPVPHPGQPPLVPRVTMTVPALSSAGLGVFLVSGRDKRKALQSLLNGEDIPAARLRPRRLIVVADRAAAP